MIPDGHSLRILVVNWQDRENPQSGGAETHMHEIFGRLADRGHEVTALVSGWRGAPDRVRLDGIDVHRAGGRHSFAVAGPLYFRRHLADEAWDVVVEDLNKVPLFMPLWTRHPVVPLFHHLFGATAFQEANPVVASLTWLLERPIPLLFRGRRGTAVSLSTIDDLAGRGLDRDTLEVIPNGIDLERYRPHPSVSRYDAPTLLYLGRLKKYKGVDLILRAFPEVLASFPEARLLIGGKGNYGGPLAELAAKLGISDSVDFLGFVPDDDKVSLFRRSWVHVLTSPKEGWGITNMEAAACGTPTVASDSPGLRESVIDGRTGLLVPHGDVDALSAALLRLLGDEAKRARMGDGAFHFAQGYSWEASADAMERLLLRAAGREAGP